MIHRLPQSSECGVTLVELMIAVVISSILVAVIFTIHVKMSVAYRGEVVKSELQQTARACPAMISDDALRAGFGITTFRIATGTFGAGTADDVEPVIVMNDADGWGPDALYMYYADPNVRANVTAITVATQDEVTVDDATPLFAVGDVVALTSSQLIDPGTGAAKYLEHSACVVRVTDVGTNSVSFENELAGEPYNDAVNPHCDDVSTTIQGGATSTLMLFQGRAYRIDPDIDRREIGVFQMSPSGGLEGDDWIDMGAGFTDLQVASRYYEDGDLADVDLDADAQHDWYSGVDQEDVAPATARPAGSVLTHLSVSVTVRSTGEVSGLGSSKTPEYIGTPVNYNMLGDQPAVDLTQPEASLPPHLRGNHLYRSSTQTIDVRNMGIGR